MPTTTRKPKAPEAPPKPDTAALEAEARHLVDELGALQAEIDAAGIAPKMRRLEALRREVSALTDQLGAPDQSLILAGTRYQAGISAREMRRRVLDVPKLAKALGSRFLACVSVSLEKLDALMPAAERSGHLAEERTGPRKIVTYRLPGVQ